MSAGSSFASFALLLCAALLGGCFEHGDSSPDDSGGSACVPEDEIPYDGLDRDCDGADLVDVDGDGYDADVAGGTDCDDGDALVSPEADEICDDQDNDCDGLVDGQDPGLLDGTTWCRDSDGDGYGDSGVTETRCNQPSGYVADCSDCDDGDASVSACADTGDTGGADPGCFVSSVSPVQLELGVDPLAPVVVNFAQAMDASTVDERSLSVVGERSGYLTGTVHYDSSRWAATFTPTVGARPGERLTAVASRVIACASGDALEPAVWRWTAAVGGGTGAFTLDSTFTTGARAYGMDLLDIDGDGFLEVITADNDDYTFSIIDDSAGPPYSLIDTINVGSPTGRLAAGDIDRDGDADFVGVYFSLASFFNDGSGSFPVVSINTALSSDNAVRGLQLGDLDGDGDLDLGTDDYSASEGNVYLNDGAGSFTLSQNLGLAGSGPHELDLADVDGDFDLDLLIPVRTSSILEPFLNDGVAGFTSGGSFGFSMPHALYANDLDGDGDVDVAAASFGGNSWVVARGDGAGAFSSYDAGGSGWGHGICGGDWDADGDIDLAYVTYSGTVRTLINDGVGGFTDGGLSGALAGDGTAIECADMNNDGALDIVAMEGPLGASSTGYLWLGVP